MVFQPVPDVVRAEIIFTQQGQRVENVLHFRKTGGWGAGSKEFLGQNLVSWYEAHLKPQHPEAVSLVSIDIRDLSSESGQAITWQAALPQVGVNGGADLPMNVTVAVRLGTLLGGRSFRGRLYHVGLRANQINGSTLTPTGQDNLRIAYQALIAAPLNTFGELVVVSYVSGGNRRPEGIATPVKSVSVDNTTDSQRRRLPGRGS